MMNEPQHPIRRTKKTPPTLANPNSLDDVGSTSVFEHKPPPRSSHHFFFRSWSTPFSCSISIAPLMGVLYGESRQKESFPFFFFFLSKYIFPEFRGALTSRQSDTVSLVIDETSDLVEIAVPLHSVLDRGGFHEESVISFLQDPIDTLVVGLGEHARPRFLHGRPHALIGRIIGILENDYFFVTINNSRFSNQLEHPRREKSPWRKWTWIHQPRLRTWFLSA